MNVQQSISNYARVYSLAVIITKPRLRANGGKLDVNETAHLLYGLVSETE